MTKLYILHNDSNKIIYSCSSFSDLVLYCNHLFNDLLSYIEQYNGNVNLFIQNMTKWKMTTSEGVFTYEYFLLSISSEQFKFSYSDNSTSNNIITISYNHPISRFNMHDINKIFISDTECSNKPVQLNFNIADVNNDNNIGTETLVNECIKENIPTDCSAIPNDGEIEISQLSLKIQQKNELLNEINQMKEKQISTLKKFLCDRKLYFIFLNENRTSDNIPELFINQWNVFQHMNSNNLLNKQIETIVYDINNNYTATEQNIIQREMRYYIDISNELCSSHKTKYELLFS